MRLVFSSSLIIQVPFLVRLQHSAVYYWDFKQRENDEYLCSLYQCWPERKDVDLGSIKVLMLYHHLFIKNLSGVWLSSILFLINTRACLSSVIHSNCSFHVCRPGSTGTGIWSFSLIKALMASTNLFRPTLATAPAVKMTGSPRKSRSQGIHKTCIYFIIILLKRAERNHLHHCKY